MCTGPLVILQPLVIFRPHIFPHDMFNLIDGFVSIYCGCCTNNIQIILFVISKYSPLSADGDAGFIHTQPRDTARSQNGVLLC